MKNATDTFITFVNWLGYAILAISFIRGASILLGVIWNETRDKLSGWSSSF